MQNSLTTEAPLAVALFVVNFFVVTRAEAPTIKLENGEFIGRRIEVNSTTQTNDFRRIDAFYGIPFADKPERFEVSTRGGDLRAFRPFAQKPRNATPSAQKRDASKLLEFVACEQPDEVLIGGVNQSADCLRLGVMKPTKLVKNKK